MIMTVIILIGYFQMFPHVMAFAVPLAMVVISYVIIWWHVAKHSKYMRRNSHRFVVRVFPEFMQLNLLLL